MKRIALCLCILLPGIVYTQTTFTTTNTGGDWSTGSTWVGGSSPAGANPIVVINGDVTLPSTTNLNNFTSITINNGKSLTRGTSGTSTHLTISNVPTFSVSNGNITVYGDLTITGTTALTFTSGNLDVRGKLSIRNGASLTFNSTGTLKAASFETGGTGGTMTVNSGTMTITGLMDIKTGSTITTGSGASSTIGSLDTSNSTDAKFVNGGTTNITGDLEYGGVITNSGTLTLGSLTGNGSSGSSFTNSGNVDVTGNVGLTSSSVLQLNPSSQMLVYGDLTVTSGAAGGGTEVITVGTAAAPPPYADLAIKGNVTLGSGGDIEIQQNGRYANFGTLTGTGDGNFQINNGGQAYVGGNISMSGGADLKNSNATDPWGFYYNGTNTTSGGTITTNDGTAAVMNSTNPVFAAWVNGVFNTLPIKLAYFRVSSTTENKIDLVWATAYEENVDRFFIEKSTDGEHFSEVYATGGTNTDQNTNVYAFSDYEPMKGRNYYRLKTLDLDGTFAYSPIITVLYKGDHALSVYPNPVKDKCINLRLNFAPLETDRIVVTNNLGVEVYRGTAGSFTERIMVRDLSSGLYHVHYVTNGFQQTIKVVVE